MAPRFCLSPLEMKYSVVIPTYNRSTELERTLSSLSRMAPRSEWEVIVVDNNSRDATRDVTEAAAVGFPARLTYLFEPVQGRCAALNTGIRTSRGEIVITTDDDVRVPRDWLDQAADGLETIGCDYAGGKVLPLWQGTPPVWMPDGAKRLWAVVALLDYGTAPVELTNRTPLGVNMAFRRHCFDRAGFWDNSLGRKAGTLLGQEVREWGLRARAADLRGFYIPDMVVHHLISADRLTKAYFRRWFYWHGVSRAILYAETGADMESPEESALDFSRVRHIAGVPRYLYRTCGHSFVEMLNAYRKRDAVAAFERELWLWFFAGIVRQRMRDCGRAQQERTQQKRGMEHG